VSTWGRDIVTERGLEPGDTVRCFEHTSAKRGAIDFFDLMGEVIKWGLDESGFEIVFVRFAVPGGYEEGYFYGNEIRLVNVVDELGRLAE